MAIHTPSDGHPQPMAREDRRQNGPVPARPARWLALVPGLLALAAFAPAVGNGFVNYDDYANFHKNPDFRGLGWHQVRWAATAVHLGVYQPLGWLALSAEYAAWGLDPRGYHLVSVLAHAAVALALEAAIVALLTRCRPEPSAGDAGAVRLAAALAAALYAVHPQRTEVVAWASCQPYLPCALCYLLAVSAYLRAHPEGRPARAGWGAAALALFAAAMLFKAVAATLPMVLLILDVYPLRRLGGGRGGWLGPRARRAWGEKLPYLALGAAFMLMAVTARERAGARLPLKVDQGALSDRVAQACYAAWFYLVAAALPTGFSSDHPIPPPIGMVVPVFALSALLLAGVSIALVALRRRWPGLLAAWAAYLAMLSLNSGLIRSTMQLVADRYSYVPMMAPTALVAAGLGRWLRGGRRRARAAGAASVAAAALLGLTALSWRQCQTWRNSRALWEHALARSWPPSAELYRNLASAVEGEAGPGPAIAYYRAALRLAPDHPVIHNNLGSALARVGRPGEAESHFRAAIRLVPDYPEAHAYLGMTLLDLGRFDEAEAHLATAVRLDPDLAPARHNLGVLLGRRGRLDEAIGQLTAAVALRPDDPDARNDLGSVLALRGRLDEAEAQFAAAVRLRPGDARARDNLAAVRRGRRRP
jgi:protein O-mannosyl-transferase